MANDKNGKERISSPEQLGDYLHVTTPAVWAVLLAVFILIGGLFVWSGVTAVESYAVGKAYVHNGAMMLRFDDAQKAENVDVGMDIHVGSLSAPVISVGKDSEGSFAVGTVDLPDGEYEARVGYKSTQILSLLFN